MHRSARRRLEIDTGVEVAIARKRIGTAAKTAPQRPVHRPKTGLRIHLPAVSGYWWKMWEYEADFRKLNSSMLSWTEGVQRIGGCQFHRRRIPLIETVCDRYFAGQRLQGRNLLGPLLRNPLQLLVPAAQLFKVRPSERCSWLLSSSSAGSWIRR